MTVASLWTRHRKLALSIANNYFLPGQEQQDVEQEALIALWAAATDYDKQRGPFPPFARLVIHRRLQELVRQANTRKHRALTDADRETDIATEDQYGGQLSLIVAALPTLSDLERSSLAASLNGQPIASKQHDNALQRARRKLAAA